MKTMLLLAAAAAAAVPERVLPAQVSIWTAPGASAYVVGDPDRAMIGVSTRSSGKRDTLGLLVESVTRGGPAERAGVEEGDRLVSVNGVNLRLSAVDAGEPDMEGVANRRLVRELGKVDAGDEVALRVYRDGATRDVRVKTVAADALNDATLRRITTGAARDAEDRAALGLSLGGSGSQRDTLGILVVAVADSGPAMRAGIEEGDRIAAINGVELRVAKEDAGDAQASRARVNRLNREVGKLKAGDAAELRVYSAGQFRTVRVEAARASEVHGQGSWYMFDNFRGAIENLRTRPPAVRVLPRTRSLESSIDGVNEMIQSRLRMEEAMRNTRRAIRSMSSSSSAAKTS